MQGLREPLLDRHPASSAETMSYQVHSGGTRTFAPSRSWKADRIDRNYDKNEAKFCGLSSFLHSFMKDPIDKDEANRIKYGPKIAEISSDEVDCERFDPNSTRSILESTRFSIIGKVERGERFCASRTLPTNPERPVNMLFYAKRRGGGWIAEFRDARGAGDREYTPADYSPEVAHHVIKIMSNLLPKIKDVKIWV